MRLGQALDAVPELGIGLRFIADLPFLLRSRRNRGLAFVQWLINFSAGPEMMQQHS